MQLKVVKIDGNETDIEAVRKAFDMAISIRDQMGGEMYWNMPGAMYWNMANDDACDLGSKLVSLGADRDEVHAKIDNRNAG